jgi:hypothetical protein
MIQAKIIKGDRLIFQSVANTKQEAELDLLYQLMQYFDFSIHINPDYNPTNSPTNNPTDRSFTDDYLELIRKTDTPMAEKIKEFKRKRKEQN